MSQPWPLYELRVRTPLLELRLPTDAELALLADRACGNVLPPERASHLSEWTQLPPGEFQSKFMQYHWLLRGNWSPVKWALALGVYPRGETEPVGMQDLRAERFLRLRTVQTSSWLLRDYQRQGLGREMRHAMLQLVFTELGALEAHTNAHEANTGSNRISQALGYHPNGVTRQVLCGESFRQLRYRLCFQDYRPRADIHVSGVGACRQLLGLS